MAVIRKIKVAPGIHWVEAPSSGLAVLCGCPADAVKHLAARALVAPTTVDGRPCQTGPNAILLSDVPVQGGRFANLSEFPFLQMFYLQGMLLPGHPNNTGVRPLLIGSSSQVRAQLAYLHRGNYGLVSARELEDSGRTAAEAAVEMAIKLRFAFGRIRPTEELVEPVLLGSEPVDLRGGLRLRRLRVNVFEFTSGGESLTVDLNLGHGEEYGPPYRLPHTLVERQRFAVVHCGDGDGWDVRRPAMSSLLCHDGRLYLIDAGPSILDVLRALGVGPNDLDGVFHTHAHDDHFCGLAALMRSDRRLRYFADPAVRASVAAKLSALVSRPLEEFHRYFEAVDLVRGRWNRVDALQVLPTFSPHPVETTVLFFRARGREGGRTYAHLADIASLSVLEGMAAEGATGLDARLLGAVRRDYLRTADIKKVDVGGGLIHGDAEDFRADASPKIYLSHTSLDLTPRQREVGEAAPFGRVDVLLGGGRGYDRGRAAGFLRERFPTLGGTDLRSLLRHPVADHPPASTLTAAGQVCTTVHLLLSGEVDASGAVPRGRRTLWAGALVGEKAALGGIPSRVTCRTVGWVRTLAMPASAYLGVLRRRGLLREAAELWERREFLQGTTLVGNGLSHPVLDRMATAMVAVSFEGPSGLDLGGRAIHLLASGRAELRAGPDLVETLEPGGFFGEAEVLFGVPDPYSVTLQGRGVLFRIPAEALEGIPSVRWTLSEVHERRLGTVLNPAAIALPSFQWRPEYDLGVPLLDEDHRELFRTAADLHTALAAGHGRDVAEGILSTLGEHAMAHFQREEDLMRERAYPARESHRQRHRALVTEMEELMGRVRAGAGPSGQEIGAFVRTWVVEHILTEDRQLAVFLGSDA